MPGTEHEPLSPVLGCEAEMLKTKITGSPRGISNQLVITTLIIFLEKHFIAHMIRTHYTSNMEIFIHFIRRRNFQVYSHPQLYKCPIVPSK